MFPPLFLVFSARMTELRCKRILAENYVYNNTVLKHLLATRPFSRREKEKRRKATLDTRYSPLVTLAFSTGNVAQFMPFPRSAVRRNQFSRLRASFPPIDPDQTRFSRVASDAITRINAYITKDINASSFCERIRASGILYTYIANGKYVFPIVELKRRYT